MGRGFGASLLTALFFATGAVASEPGVQCLQAVLNAARYDAGPEDGLIGRRTRAALSEFREDTPLAISEAVSRHNAVVYCRLAGEARPALKEYWPSRKLRYELSFGANVDASNQRDVRLGLDAFNTLMDELSIPELPLTARVFVVGSQEAFRTALIREFGQPARQARALANRGCHRTGMTAGRNEKGGTLICLASGSGPAGRVSRMDVWEILAHELFHDAQRQLGGSVPWERTPDGYSAPLGPVWLIEGSAEFVEKAMVKGLSNRWGIGRSAAWFTADTIAAWPPLTKLSLISLEGSVSRDVYDAGLLATFHLTDDRHPATIGAFFGEVGRGLTWTDAFQAAFGLSLEEFSAQFAKIAPSLAEKR